MNRYVSYAVINSDGTFSDTGSIHVRNIGRHTQYYERIAEDFLRKSGADHVVYAMKRYDIKDRIQSVTFYPDRSLTDAEFQDLIFASPNYRICALHKRP